MRLRALYRRWQARRRERVARDYGHLSGAERAEVERLRDEHDPLGEMARGRTPPPFRDDRP
jgi:hypothetical protein